jgi:hypothetical protein
MGQGRSISAIPKIKKRPLGRFFEKLVQEVPYACKHHY